MYSYDYALILSGSAIDVPVVSVDEKILAYSDVKTISPY